MQEAVPGGFFSKGRYGDQNIGSKRFFGLRVAGCELKEGAIESFKG